VSYLLAFAGFAALIILHELGHFVAAKAVGMRVERFALFFPPLIFKWRPANSETEYGIGSIPFGGYVKITGMNPEEDIPADVVERAYYRQPVWKRIVVIAAGPAVNIVLAFVILWVLFATQPKLFAAPVVDHVEKGSAAAGVLLPRDRILSADGKAGFAAGLTPQQGETRVAALQKTIKAHHCASAPRAGCAATKPVKLVVLRDGQRRTLDVVPRYDTVSKRLLIGFAFGTRGVPVGIGAAAHTSLTWMWRVTTQTVDRVVRIFYDPKSRKDVSGVVGSFEVTRESIQFDAVQAMSVLALISLSLGVINLFPFLPLDGGHIFWALAEKLRGRAISLRLMERASVVGIMLVLFLAYVGLSNDIGRITSGQGFNVR
jgi:regulator of sigma E protease